MKLILSFLMTAALAFSAAAQEKKDFIGPGARDALKKELVQRYGEAQRPRIERGIDQVAGSWRAEDGDPAAFAEFCRQAFVADPAALDTLFRKLEFYGEVLGGTFNEMELDKNQPVDLDWGDITPLDMAMAQFSPSAHLSDDLFQTKIRFWSLLNFPIFTLKEKTEQGPGWSRKQWAMARIAGTNPTRIPAEINQRYAAAFMEANRYIAEYNIFVGRLVDGRRRSFFPADMRLTTHWGLRDEIRARYADPQGLAKQRLIQKAMERIIRQEIPAVMVNSDRYQWDPATNKVYDGSREITAEREPDTRYRTLLNLFEVTRLVDPYNPLYPTALSRSFEVEREIPEADIVSMFEEVLAAPQAKAIGRLIQRRLGRPLEPFDIWYTGLRPKPQISEEELDRIVAAKYPTREAFEKDLPNILIKLGFSPERAADIASRIQVDPSRGAGHNAQTSSRRFKSRLRTRVGSKGMDYKGYNIAIHEFGHAVENILDTQKIDYVSLAGVPSSGFTEAFAFLFQARDLELLGLSDKDPRVEDLQALNKFWEAYECAGVSLVDIKTWHWLYDHPQATPAELKAAMIAIAVDIWNRYYAPVFGVRDQVILAVYSHMFYVPLYMSHYALGDLIHFQIEEYLRGKVLGREIERMCAAGNIIPQLWMKNAVGEELSAKPMLEAAARALARFK